MIFYLLLFLLSSGVVVNPVYEEDSRVRYDVKT